MELARTLFYHIAKHIAWFVLAIRYNFSFTNNPLKKLKGSYLILGHHVSDFDAVYSNIASSQLVRFLAGDVNMDTPWKKHLFIFLGMIPFKKKKSDMKSIRKLMALAKNNHPIGLYPEGGRNWDGATDQLILSTAKLIKLVHVPVYVTFYKGGFLSKPRWADYSRRGVINFEASLLMSSDEVQSMTPIQIYQKMQLGLSYNEFDWQKEHMIKFKGKKRAERIERLLYKCPNCGEVATIESHGHDFGCKACGIDYHMNVYGFIEGCEQFDDTHKWHTWQKSFIPEIAKTMDTFTLRDIPFEKRHNKTKERALYTCDVTISEDAITIAYDDTEEIIPIASAFGFSVTLLDIFEFFTTHYKYRLSFDPTRHLPIVFVLNILNHLKETIKNE